MKLSLRYWQAGHSATDESLRLLGLEQSLYYIEEGTGPKKALEQAV